MDFFAYIKSIETHKVDKKEEEKEEKLIIIWMKIFKQELPDGFT